MLPQITSSNAGPWNPPALVSQCREWEGVRGWNEQGGPNVVAMGIRKMADRFGKELGFGGHGVCQILPPSQAQFPYPCGLVPVISLL